MTYSEFRTYVTDEIGRPDMNIGVGSPVVYPISKYINIAVDYLENLPALAESKNWYCTNITSGTKMIAVPKCNVIREVWTADAQGGESKLVLRSSNFIKNYYSSSVNIVSSVNRPYDYAVINARLCAEQSDLASGDFTDEFSYGSDLLQFSDMNGGGFDYKTIAIAPSPNATITLKVLGEFASTELSADDDSNIWTTNYWDLLSLVTQHYVLLLKYQNPTRAASLLVAAESRVKKLRNKIISELVQSRYPRRK